MAHRSRSFIPWCLVLASTVLAVGCTSGTSLGSSGTVSLTPPAGTTAVGAPTTSSSPTPTPVTPDGMTLGAGVDDSTITLGLIVNRAQDRGFAVGVQLWQSTVNKAGGICGRTIRLMGSTADGSSGTADSLSAEYLRLAGSTLGLITLPSQAETSSLAALSGADQVPTLTLSGSSAGLQKFGPVIVGATEDIKAINALSYLVDTRKFAKGSVVGFLGDDTANAANALAGAKWWAARNGFGISAHVVGEKADWTGDVAVLVIAPPAQVLTVLHATIDAVPVVTNLDGYDERVIPSPAGRLLIAIPSPGYSSDNPGAAAVAKAFVASGRTDPGPSLLPGYGVALTWGRVLQQACTDRNLTKSGVAAAMGTVGPASVDSLFGPSDPGLATGSLLPATRVSSMAIADPAAPTGLRPLIWLQAAPGIAEYLPRG